MFCICCGAGNPGLGSPLGTPVRQLFREVSESSRGKGRLKAGCSQDWLPHNLGGMVSRIKKYAALGQDPAPGIPSVCPKIMNATLIPVYQADGSLYAWASEQRFARLQLTGMVARVVRQRKGHISRAILFLRPGAPKPLSASSMMGTRYSFKESLVHGRAWDLKHLNGTRGGRAYAPPGMRPDFLRVVFLALAGCALAASALFSAHRRRKAS